MDGKSSGVGFRISAEEVDFVAPPEEASSSRDPSFLQKAFSESVAKDFDKISTEIKIPMEIAENNNSQYRTAATVIPYSPPGGDSFAAASEGGNSGIIGFNNRPNGGSTLAAASSRLSAVSTTPKVGKKRSRASRRAPTTVLTTDTSNFRAMVQEFTGIPTSPFSSVPFQRHGIDFLGAPRPAGLPSFLQRPFPHRIPIPSIHNYTPIPQAPGSIPSPGNYFMQAQRPPGDWIPLPLPASNNFGSAGELGLNVVLPDLVPSDGRPQVRTPDVPSLKNTTNNNNINVGGDGGRAFDRRLSALSFGSDESSKAPEARSRYDRLLD